SALAADRVPVVLQRYPSIVDRQRRFGARREISQSDFRSGFSRGAARSPVDLVYDLELRREFPRTRQRGDAVRLKGDGESARAEQGQGSRQQSADYVPVFAR